jgi:hypothetical protein
MSFRRGHVYTGKLAAYPADRWLIVSQPILTSALAVPLRQDVSPGEMEQFTRGDLAPFAACLVLVNETYTAVCFRITLVEERQLADDGWDLRRPAMEAVEAGLRAALYLPEPNQ